MTTVAMKPIPSANAASLKRLLSMMTLPSMPTEDDKSSEVTRSIMALTASHNPMSEADSGNAISIIPEHPEVYFHGSGVWRNVQGFY